MKASEAAEVRKTAMAQAADTKATEEEGKEEGDNLGTHPIPPVEVLPESSAQVSSVVGGAAGQAHGLPRPVTQKDLDDQKKKEEERSDDAAEGGKKKKKK